MDRIDPFDVASECVAFAVRRASRLVTSHYDAHLAEAGMRSTQFTILNGLRALGDVTINDLAAQLQMDRTTLTRNLSLLESRSWIERLPGPDRRVRLVRLAAGGQAALASANSAWQTAQNMLLERLGDSHYRKLMENLDLLEEALI
jgi:DNA-binding MarR family transcriptional regulator